MTELDPSMKKKKKIEANFSQEPVQESVDNHIPLKKLWQKSIINLNPETLIFQRKKRLKATKWSLSLHERPLGFQPLGKIARLDKSLKKFVLSVDELNDRDLHLLAHGLKGLKCLESIVLEIGDYCKLKSRGLSYSMKELTRLSSLKRLLLNVSNSDISDGGLSSTSRSIKKMTFLKDIYINFSDLPQTTDKGMSQMINSFNRLRRLEDVTLMIRKCSQMVDESLTNMRFERLFSLQNIYLDFGFCHQLTDKSIDLITKGLKKLPNLQSIKLKFWDCDKFSDASLHNIWELINSLPSLRGVTLQFTDCLEITDAAFDDMNKTLKNSLALIQKFHMEFYSCYNLTDHGLVDLYRVLKRAVSLQNLSVYWRDCDEITDVGVKAVVDCMSKLTHLRKIGIDFFHFLPRNDTRLKEISKFFESRTSLEKITLGVEVSHDMDDGKSIDYLFDDVMRDLKIKMPNLRIKYYSKPDYKVEY